ncbi:MAG: SEL1-like repeat protein [Rhodospirillales bacterium]|nr:SEL1-like repeat protein [Rhodospirillales bacterium]
MALRRKRLWIGGGILAAAIAVAFFALHEDQAEVERAKIRAEHLARFYAIEPKAKAGEPAAQFALAQYFQKGLGVDKNPAQAIQWYRKAAEKAHIEAQFALGKMYESGEGPKQDFRRAAEWYELAANLGRHAGAQFALGQLYYDGRGVANDPAEAVKWYRLSAERGHPGAQYRLGAIYEAGWAVKADPAEAYKWYTLSTRKRAEAMAINKDFDAAAALKKLAANITRFEISRGELRAKKFRPESGGASFLREGTSLVGTPSSNRSIPEPKPQIRRGLRILAIDVPLADNEAKPFSVNLIVELIDPAHSSAVCGLAPRVRDAVFQALWSNPVPIRGGRPHLGAVHARLLDPVNRGLGSAVVKSAFVYPGNGPLSRNDVLQTPFDEVVECGNGP